MFQSYVMAAIRNLINSKLYTVINILGLAIGLASCLLIILFVRFETSYDLFLPNLDRLYRMEAAANVPGRERIYVPSFSGSTKELLPQDYPEIEEVLRIQQNGASVVNGSDVFNETLSYVDANFFSVFELPLVEGDIATALEGPSNIVLSEEMARKYFGDGPYLGKTLTINHNYERDHKVTGVLADIPDNSHLALDILLPIEPRVYEEASNADGGTTDLNRWNGLPFYVYLKLREGASIETVAATINDWVDRYFPKEISALVNIKGSELWTPHFVPVADIHLGSPAQGDMKARGSTTTMYTFASIAVLILLIACINFMNLATARSTLRGREVSVRKVWGASRRQLMAQFQGESFLLASMALVMATVILYFILPSFETFTQIAVPFSLLGEPLVMATALGLTLFVGLAAGAHPALVLSNIRPAKVLSASGPAFPASSKLRTSLVVLQFVISAALMIGATLIYVQTNYASNLDFGYVKDNRIIVRGLRDPQVSGQKDAFQQRINQLPGVVATSLASFAPGDGIGTGLSLGVAGEAEPVIIFYRSIDWDFFDLYGVEPIAGRIFSRQRPNDDSTQPPLPPPVEGEEVPTAPARANNVIINMAAARRLGHTTAEAALGQVLVSGRGQQNTLTVVGVIPDIQLTSPRQAVQEEMYMLDRDAFGTLNIHYQTDDPEALGQEIDRVWLEMFPSQPVFRNFLSNNIERQFQFEQVVGRLLAIFSGLAVLVACMGLFGLASFTVVRRTREIGIRKVMGASSNKILGLLLRQMSTPVVMANVIAWPIVWYAITEWLQAFNYRIDLEIYFVGAAIAAVILTLIIAWMTVVGHALRIARTNPIHALRYE